MFFQVIQNDVLLLLISDVEILSFFCSYLYCNIKIRQIPVSFLHKTGFQYPQINRYFTAPLAKPQTALQAGLNDLLLALTFYSTCLDSMFPRLCIADSICFVVVKSCSVSCFTVEVSSFMVFKETRTCLPASF